MENEAMKYDDSDYKDEQFLLSMPPHTELCTGCWGEGYSYAIEYFEGKHETCEDCGGKGWMPIQDASE
jgi:hypothetical protein